MSAGPPPLLLAAHGGGDGTAANRVVEALREQVAGSWGADVLVAFQRGTPSFQDVAVPAGALVLPLLAANGYFARQRLPEALGVRDVGSDLSLLPPLGTLTELHRALAEEVSRRAQALDHPPLVVVAAHGTRRDPRSGDLAYEVATCIRDQAGPLVQEVRCGFIDQDPELADVVRGVDDPLLVVPWMWGGGGHLLDDVPEALREARGPIDMLPPLSERDDLAELVLRVAHEAAARREGAPA